MHVTLIGLGCGDMETITAAAQRALSRAEGIFGSRRLLEALPPSGAQRVAAVQPEEIRDHLIHAGWAESCVILSGDTGFTRGEAPAACAGGGGVYDDGAAGDLQPASFFGQAETQLAGLAPLFCPWSSGGPGGGGMPWEARIFPHWR